MGTILGAAWVHAAEGSPGASWCLRALGWGCTGVGMEEGMLPGKGPDFHVFSWKGLPRGMGWSLSHMSVHRDGSVVESRRCSCPREEGQHGVSLP